MPEPRRQRRDRDGGYSDLQERVVEINRVAKVVKGGRRFSFTALVVVGDEKSQVGVGYGKANEVPAAIQKGVERARKNLYRVPMHGSTLTHEVLGVHSAARGARARGHPRRALEVARQPEPDQPREGDDGGARVAAAPRGRRRPARHQRGRGARPARSRARGDGGAGLMADTVRLKQVRSPN